MPIMGQSFFEVAFVPSRASLSPQTLVTGIESIPAQNPRFNSKHR